MGNVRVFTLLAGLTALFGAVGYALGGTQLMLIALVLAAAMNVIAYFFSATMALRAYRARVMGPQEAPDLYATVDRLRQRAGLPMPTVAIAPHEQANAFATGRNPETAVVCVTEGLLRLVNQDELEGVLAHELGHVRNRDMLLQTVTATLAGAVANLARITYFAGGRRDRAPGGPLFLLFGPLAAMLLQFGISRQREFEADRAGAEISGKPLALASALEKLDAVARRVPLRVAPTYAPLAQVNPLAAYGGGLFSLFSTHPATEKRVARLRAMAGPA